MRGKFGPFLLAAAAVLCLDQATKAWVRGSFQLYESQPVLDGLVRLIYVRNPGAAFGFLSQRFESFRLPFLLIVTAVALIVILAVVQRLTAPRPWTLLALGLVFGGAVGNLIDRVRWGEVVDFIDVFWKSYHWPTFNVADSGITVGIVMLILEELFGARNKKAAQR